MRTHRFISTAAFAALVLAAAACATSVMPPYATEFSPVHSVILEGKPVQTIHENVLLDVLRSRGGSFRLVLEGVRQDQEPLLIIDKVIVSGTVSRLAEMSAKEVKRVTTLRSDDACCATVRPGTMARLSWRP